MLCCAQGTTAGLQARELTIGQLLGMEEVSEVAFAECIEFTTATATFFLSKHAVIIVAQ